MYCKRCGIEISSDAKFCPRCGMRLQEDTLSENQNGVQSKTVNTVAFTIAIIAAIIYLIAVLVLAPQVTHYAFSTPSNSPAGVAICALVSAVLSFASLCCFAFLKKNKAEIKSAWCGRIHYCYYYFCSRRYYKHNFFCRMLMIISKK